MSTTSSSRPDYLEILARIVDEVVEPSATVIDRTGAFPRAAVDALGKAGLLGLVSARDVGGLGEGHRAATFVVEALARACGSTAMVVLMHYVAAADIEAHGPRKLREAIAAGNHLSTIALSEVGSRSQFWVPLGTATADKGRIRLDASKSWVTSAGEADSYVWTSRPVSAPGAITSSTPSATTVPPSSLWIVPRSAPGLSIPVLFDGLGLRGNASSPIIAQGVLVDAADRLGPDGGAFDIMMEINLPWFNLMNAGFALGTMEAVTAKSVAHASSTRFEHLGQTLAEQPLTRAHIARMRIKTDMVRGLLLDALAALESGRSDTMLRILEVKAAAGEAVIEVTDLAMRVCGGAAFRKEVGVERHFRDARAATVMAPTTDALYDFIGKAVCGLPLF